ncbi:DUF262 domain-containing protein [Nocardioides marmoraquaticus]
METPKFNPTKFKVADFLSWQRSGTLDLSPEFQRRSVWKRGAKSYLVDTVHRGLPVPLVFLRDRLDLATGLNVREVVDGQQRLRTLLSFIDPRCIADFRPDADQFVVSATHDRTIAGRTFDELQDESKKKILGYEFSVQALPENFSNKQVLEVFARLNSTGQRLNAQELRNAAHFGELKTLMYSLAYKWMDQWLAWGVYTPEQISRMNEVEMVSDLSYNVMHGLSGKSQPRLNRFYASNDDVFEHAGELARQFDAVMECIDEVYGDLMAKSVFSREVHFFTLWIYVYDQLFDLASEDFEEASAPPESLRRGLTEASRRFKELEVPPEVLDAASRASADFGRRRTRFKFLSRVVGNA